MKKRYALDWTRYRSLDEEESARMKKKRPPQRMIASSENLRKLYIEPTSRCNLQCAMCPRHTWMNEPLGDMDLEIFAKIMEEIKTLKTLETIFFGGVAEPMTHPNIVDMVRLAKTSGVTVELISNGSMLHERNVEELLRAGLDRLWISLDGQHVESEQRITGIDGAQRTRRLLQTFQSKKNQVKSRAQLGISFVATKSNIHWLPDIVEMARNANVEEVKVSNLIPYTREMESEVLYQKTLACDLHKEDPNMGASMLLNLPIMDFESIPSETLQHLLAQKIDLQMGKDRILRRNRYCTFVEEDSTFIRWDGEVSPCMALLHTNKTFLQGIERIVTHCSFGNIKDRNFLQIWGDPLYQNFRKKVKEFAFSPCPTCGHCSLMEENQEDCYGNEFPTCGACMWAEGFAQCP